MKEIIITARPIFGNKQTFTIPIRKQIFWEYGLYNKSVLGRRHRLFWTYQVMYNNKSFGYCNMTYRVSDLGKTKFKAITS